MDDSRLGNLLFLAGIASLAIPGCGDVGEPGEVRDANPPGNPLASQGSLGGANLVEVCNAYLSKALECGGGYGEYDTGYYYGVSVAPGFADDCAQVVAELQADARPGCLSATAETYSCLSGLSCEVFGFDDSACAAARQAEVACNVGGVAEDDRE